MTGSSLEGEAASEVNIELELCLNCFDPFELSELVKLFSPKPSFCMSDPVPTNLFKEVFPLNPTSILDRIILSLLQGN